MIKTCNNKVLKDACKNRIKCLTGVKKDCSCGLVAKLKDGSMARMNTPEIIKKINAIQAGMEHLRESGLNDRAIVVLLQDAVKMPKKQIEKLLECIKNIETIYCGETDEQ